MEETRSALQGPRHQAALAAFPMLVDPEVTPLDGGLLHESFAVRDGEREYILQRVSEAFSPRIHDNIRAVTQHLEARGMPTFRLLDAAGGRPFVDIDGEGRWRLLTRLPGVSFDTCAGPDPVVSSARAGSAGAIVARFHTALRDFDAELHPLGFPYHETPRHLADLRAALEQHPSHRLIAPVKELASAVSLALDAWSNAEELPQRVIHGDLKFSNILFEGAADVEVGADRGEDGAGEVERVGSAPPLRATALIDFDTLSRRPLYFDLGDAWRSWCNPRGEDVEQAELDLAPFRSSAEGYLASLGFELCHDELVSLAEGIERVSLELCARFAADALQESYFGWDEQRFESAGDHNLVRSRGQLSLYGQARDTREERLGFLLG